MAPSTRPSMYNDSEPVTSPLITSDLPMVACSWLLRTALRGAAAGVGSLKVVWLVLMVGLSASGVGLTVGLGLGLGFGGLAGFHISIHPFLIGRIFLSLIEHFMAPHGLIQPST